MFSTQVVEVLQMKPTNPRNQAPKKPRLLFPPPQPGMTTLDKTAFTKIVTVPALLVDQRNIPTVTKSLKRYFLKMPKFNPVQPDSSNPSQKWIYLNPELLPPSTDLSEFLLQHLDPSTLPTILSSQFEETKFSYENWRWDEVLNAIIPDEFEKTRSFTMVGTLVHLNLRDHLLPYKSIIGQVLLDGVPQARTVVNKLTTIDNTYRNFQMEVLAGDPNTIVKLKENGVEFEFDFATVYWNSRLSSEHERILEYLQPRDLLFDVFAGVGPFSVPAARKKCFVMANDLNPQSHHWLVHNFGKQKKVSSGWIQTFNLDGRQFITQHLPKFLIKSPPASSGFEGFESWTKKIHVTMNLPALAVNFLDAFWGLVKEGQLDKLVDVTVHVYLFIKAAVEEEEYRLMAVELVQKELRFKLGSSRILEVFFVRNVAPNKNMYRVSFNLPHQVLTTKPPPASVGEAEGDVEADPGGPSPFPKPKRLKTDEDAAGEDRDFL